MKIGAQLYTVREHCKTLEDFAETLKKVADIGYTTVQVSGTCPYDAQWLKDQLDKNGLKCVLTHIPDAKLREETQDVCQNHKIFGAGCVGLGKYNLPGEDLAAEYAKFVELYKPIAKAIRDNGLYFMYHNHDQEFQHLNGKTIMEHMAEDFAPEEMGFTLDTFWVQAGGGSPVEWIERLKGRLPCIHLKDYAFAKGGFMNNIAPVGEGNINFAPIIRAAAEAGTEYLLVEQDDCHGQDPFECLARSYRHLRALGLD